MVAISSSRLVEVLMITEQGDYAPDKLRRYLRRYHEIAMLADGAHGIRYDRDERGRTDERDPMKNAHIKRDLDAAIGWLQMMDFRAAEMVAAHYIDLKECADVADRFDISQRTVHRVISSSIQEMAGFLGWRKPATEPQDALIA